MISVWKFDDLWEDGWRFDDIINSRWLIVDRKFAKNEHEAADFLSKAHKFIPKNQGTSQRLKDADICNGIAVVTKE